MLEKQSWIRLAPDMMTEWRQCMEEGHDAASFRAECERIARCAEEKDCEAEALALTEQMAHTPIRADYSYVEPSDIDGIEKACEGNKALAWQAYLDEAALRDKITGAWLGRISGCLLGKPLECLRTDIINELLAKSGNQPLTKYIAARDMPAELVERIDHYERAPWRKCWIDRIHGAAPVDDDTNYTVLALRLVDEYGMDFRPNDVLEGWLYWLPMFSTCTAERAAYRNAASGLLAPMTAEHANPYREWIGAQIRGDFFGYISPGKPHQAAEMAWRDASISHVKNGIYGEMFVAAMLACAAVTGNAAGVIETGLREIPSKSRFAEGIRLVLDWYGDGVPQKEVFDRIHARYDEFDQHDWCHTISNAMIVAASMLYCEKDFGRAICMAAETGFDTDCNAATVGSVMGMLLGEKAIPSQWGDAFGRTLKTSISGYERISVTQLVDKTLAIINMSK